MADLLDVAEVERVAALGRLDVRTQSELGQFFTPASATRLISSMPRLPDSGTLRVLDPGAGSGALSAALVSRALLESPSLSIEVVAVERDPAVLPSLQVTLSACERVGGGRVHAEAIEGDFILDSVGLGASLSLDSQFDLVIENPPYGKLAASSSHRSAMRAAGVDTRTYTRRSLPCQLRHCDQAARSLRLRRGRSSKGRTSERFAPMCWTPLRSIGCMSSNPDPPCSPTRACSRRT